MLYAGSTLGKIYKSPDGAESWKQVYDLGRHQTIGAIKVSPHDENLALAGTYDGELLVSRDGGETWQKQGESQGLAIKGSVSGDVAFDPSDRNIIYLAPSFFDVEKEGGGSGLFKSVDGGKTWKKTGQGIETDIVSKIAIDPKNPDHLMVAAGSTFEWGYSTHGLYQSFDGGETFQKVSPDFQPFRHSLPYVAFSGDGNRIIVGSHPGGEDFYISTDGGRTWKAKTGLWGDFITDVAQFSDENRFVVSLYWSAIFYTEDGGNSWHEVAIFKQPNLHNVYAPKFDADLVFASAHSNGQFFSGDKGKTWKRIVTHPGDPIFESVLHNYETSSSRFSPEILWVRSEFTSDVVAVRNPASSNAVWKKVATVPGEMTAMKAHPNIQRKAYVGSDRGLYLADYDSSSYETVGMFSGKKVIAIAVDEDRMAVGANDGLFISENRGESWERVGLAGVEVKAVGLGSFDVYAAADDGLYRYSGGSLEKMSSPEKVSQIIEDPGDRNVTYVATNDKIYSSLDGGKTFDVEESGLRHSPSPNPLKLSVSADGMAIYLATNGLGVWRADLRSEPLPFEKAVVTEDKSGGVGGPVEKAGTEVPKAIEELQEPRGFEKQGKNFFESLIETIASFFRSLFGG